ncbi:protein kinase domain-containing protein [Tuwongella immobilis]|uniref:Protein kinase domain-containing protein n=1 Tax=Tuwongella immobilis TaxID=692036 RepID=A0A6C2YQQ1_9BACT|nr:protein kinase [Tuwongella immobilis]VIP03661.1 serine threonine protein kinase : Serine/threonine protein kinase OS=Isosphaera pallida (strain ATCC 43644 / DSM 9630 / IS1B) GN=Isop_1601 PE=4 SV=1: Pkinase: RDD [Tuwongella immobilis]VTS04690.1 serine threonine protein kinase : Serine/threonine protein kinase OS=Isosphaera pallida (strain ATCC 43644 / DSM 9630 / IS1B) GN=Isop_1601 PE=4 SV=1: Pkinase: RDD [Tuwongella immobilis]
MQLSIECPQCKRVVEYTKEVPNFCSHCGQRLSQSNPPASRRSNANPTTEEYDGALLPFSNDDSANRTNEHIPNAIGNYRLLSLLGSGGMGRVYLAEATDTGQRVAVKLLASQQGSSGNSVERFRQEGQLASQISHPRCVFVYGADTDQGRPYIVMELMPGNTLKDLVESRGPLPYLEAVQLILDVIDGLQEAHRLGVIHRDVKPSNCFLMPDGRVKIGDFGLSKSLSSTRDLTQTGAFLGTVLYASPEQIRGQDVNYASDVYSLCATLFYLVTGRAPFEQENVTAALARIISEEAPRVRSIRPDLPRSLDAILAHGLEREHAWRIQTLEELRSALITLVPNQLSFGGLGIRVMAYVVDFMLVRFLLAFLYSWLVTTAFDSTGRFARNTETLLLPIYFIVLEGLWGASLGKRLFRLRVCQAGTTEPPGIERTIIRTVVFGILIILTFSQIGTLISSLDSDGVTGQLWRSLFIFLAGLVVLIVPMRRSNDYRGLHEWASGTCVMQLPSRRPPMRYRSRLPNRLDSLLPLGPELPKSIGPYTIRAASGIGPNGERVLLGEDSLLGRNVVIRLRPLPPDAPTDLTLDLQQRLHVSRPTRIRVLTIGQIQIGLQTMRWEAYVAPLGAPLQDIPSPRQSLNWSQTRPLLEQLTEELLAAQADQTLPATLSLAQVWVQPEGQVQLLDFAIPPSLESAGNHPPSGTPIALLQQASVLCLEGAIPADLPARARQSTAIHAPVPRHVETMLRELFGSKPNDESLARWNQSLETTRPLPERVTSLGRIAQLAFQGMFLIPGVLLMCLISGLFGLLREAPLLLRVSESRMLLALEELAPTPNQPDTELSEEELLWLRQLEEDLETLLESHKQRLNFVERVMVLEVLKSSNQVGDATIPMEVIAQAKKDLATSRIPELILIPELTPLFPQLASQSMMIVAAVPLLWALLAWCLRGGISFQLMSYHWVTWDGRPAPRRFLALRVLLTWLPMTVFLCASIAVSTMETETTALRTVLWFCGVATAPLYILTVIWRPNRSPIDRMLKICLVPN